MIRAKWLSIIVCACLFLSPQSNISANLWPAQTEPPHEFDRLRQMITGDPAQFYVPTNEPAPAPDPAPQPDPGAFAKPDHVATAATYLPLTTYPRISPVIPKTAPSSDWPTLGKDNQHSNFTPAYLDGKIYTWVNGIFSEHDPVDGKVVWNLPQAWNQTGSISVPVLANRTAIVADALTLHAIDLDHHKARWTVNGSYDLTLPSVAGEMVYAINGGVLEARQLSNGAMTASFNAPSALLNGPVVSEAHIYVATASHTYVLNRATLQVEWTVSEGGWLTLTNGYLLIARSDGYVFAYRAQER